MKRYNLGIVKVEIETNGFIKGLILNREVTIRESKYILEKLLGFVLNTKEECYDEEEYQDYNMQVKRDVNAWLRGECDDFRISEYSCDWLGEGYIGAIQMISVLNYLKRRGIIG